MKDNIFFSVIICCYNSEKYLRETIDSIINQTHTNWEIIAVNDGSIDGTEEIILEYIQHGIPITYHKQDNKGFSEARNKALELAKSDWIAIIDHDDICLIDRLEIQSTHILENPNAKLFFANTIHFNDEGVEIRRQFDRFNPCKLDLKAGNAFNNLLIHGCYIDTEAVIFNKEAALCVGGFNAEYKYFADSDFFRRMGSKYDMFAGEEIVSKWRVHNKQLTQTMGNIIRLESKQMFKEYYHFIGISKRAKFAMKFHLFKYYIKLLFGKFISS